MKYFCLFLFVNFASAGFAKLNILSQANLTQILIEAKSWPADAIGLQVFKMVNGKEILISDSLHLPYYTEKKSFDYALYPGESIEQLQNIIKEKLEYHIIEKFDKKSSLATLKKAHPSQLKGEKLRSKMDFDRARILGWGLIDKIKYNPSIKFVLKAVYVNGDVKIIHQVNPTKILDMGWSHSLQLNERLSDEKGDLRKFFLDWNYSLDQLEKYSIDGFWFEVYHKNKKVKESSVYFRGKKSSDGLTIKYYDRFLRGLKENREFEFRIIPQLKFGKAKVHKTFKIHTNTDYFKKIQINNFDFGRVNLDLSLLQMKWTVLWGKYFKHVEKMEYYQRAIGESAWVLKRSSKTPFESLAYMNDDWIKNKLLKGKGFEIKLKLYPSISWAKGPKEFIFQVTSEKWKTYYQGHSTPLNPKPEKKLILNSPMYGIEDRPIVDLNLKAEFKLDESKSRKMANSAYLEVTWNDSTYKKSNLKIRINGKKQFSGESPYRINLDNRAKSKMYISVAAADYITPKLADTLTVPIPELSNQSGIQFNTKRSRLGNKKIIQFQCNHKNVLKYNVYNGTSPKNNSHYVVDSLVKSYLPSDSVCVFETAEMKEVRKSLYYYLEAEYVLGLRPKLLEIRADLKYILDDKVDLPTLTNAEYKKKSHLAYLEFDYSAFKSSDKYDLYEIRLKSRKGRVVQSKQVSYDDIIKRPKLTLGWLNDKNLVSGEYSLQILAVTKSNQLKSNFSELFVYVPNVQLPTIKNFGYDVIKKGQIKLSWEFPEGLKELESLTLSYDDQAIDVSESKGSFVVKGLKAKKEYQFQLKATSNMKTGESLSTSLLYIYK